MVVLIRPGHLTTCLGIGPTGAQETCEERTYNHETKSWETTTHTETEQSGMGDMPKISWFMMELGHGRQTDDL